MKPKHYKPEYAVAQTVADMQRKFVYPDSTFRAGPPLVSGGGGAPRFVVAPVDASPDSARKADFQCSGVADQTNLQSIVDEFGNAGGLLILTEGTFNFTDLWTISGPTWVRGAGNRASFIIGSAAFGALVLLGDNGKLSDIYVENTSANSLAEGVRMTGAESQMDNCNIFCNGGPAVRVLGDLVQVRSSYVHGGSFGIRQTTGQDLWILDSYVEADSVGIELVNIQNHVRGNTIDAGGDGIAGTADDCIVLGNIIAAGGTPINITGTGNVIDHNVT